MIYLFSSGTRPLYAADVLNILGLPSGATVVLRYRTGGEQLHVWPRLSAALQGAPGARRLRRGKDRLVRSLAWLTPLTSKVPQATPVVVLFVDRDNGYTYLPLRRGTLLETWERDNRRYFRVQLGEFLAARQSAHAEVSNRIKAALRNDGPGVRQHAQSPADDGHYAIDGEDVLSGHDDIATGEEGWSAAVDALKDTDTFRTTDTRVVVFVRANIERHGGGNEAQPKLARGLERVLIRKDTPYAIRVSYRCAMDKLEPPPAEIIVQAGDSLQQLSSGPLLVAAKADDLMVPVLTKRYADDRYSYLRIATQPVDETRGIEVRGPNLNVLVGLKEARWFWPTVILTLGIFAVTSLITSVKPSDISGSGSADLGTALLAQITWWRFAAAAVQAIFLFVLFRLIGKKPV